MLHAIVILGITFTAPADAGSGAPGLQVLLVSDELPESNANDAATYLAQRTQVGSGNTTKIVAPRNRASAVPLPGQDGTPDGLDLGPGRQVRRVATRRTCSRRRAWQTKVHYLADAGDTGDSRKTPALIKEQPSDHPGPEDETGPEQLTRPETRRALDYARYACGNACALSRRMAP